MIHWKMIIFFLNNQERLAFSIFVLKCYENMNTFWMVMMQKLLEISEDEERQIIKTKTKMISYFK